MTFDVGELAGRAGQLKQLAIDKFVEACTRAAAGAPGGYVPVGQYQQYAEKMFADVDSIYDDFLDCPAPEDFAHLTDNLGRAMSQLAVSGYDKDPVGNGSSFGAANPDLAGVLSSGDYMADWTGDAATTYKTNFADRFEPVTSNQFILTSVVRNALNAEAAIWQTVRDDLDKLSKDALDKMEECGHKSPSDWSMVLTIAGAVVAIAAVPLTGGTSLELGLAAVGAGLGVAATGMGGSGGEPDELDLQTGSPQAIVDSLRDVLGRIKGYVTEHENTIWDTMSQTATDVDSGWELVCLPRPALADAGQHRYDDRHYLGHSNG